MTSLFSQFQIAAAYLRTRWLTARLKTRADVTAWQYRQLERFLAGPVAAVPAYRELAGHPLEDFPIQDKARLMAEFERHNRLGMTSAEARDAWEKDRSPKGYAVGASTGTSGNRGFYVVSDAERYAWLGVILGRGLPGFWRDRLKVAILLPANSRLYDAANESRRLSLRFFDLHEGMERQAEAVEAWQPDVLVAPPKVLRLLSDRPSELAPRHVFSGAEVLDPLDRERIEARFGVTVREIYMATEGLFAIACPHGRLHLLEDHIAFEWEDDPAGGRLKSPLITDFTRRTQVMVRYRMNDLLELDTGPCPCGSPFTVVRAIAGRMDDVLSLPGPDGNVFITPDILRNTIIDADPGIGDFRLVQTSPDRVVITLPPENESAALNAGQALQALFDRLGARVQLDSRIEPLPPPDSRKLRRVMRLKP